MVNFFSFILFQRRDNLKTREKVLNEEMIKTIGFAPLGILNGSYYKCVIKGKGAEWYCYYYYIKNAVNFI